MANNKKNHTPPQETDEEISENLPIVRWNVGSVFWGLLFIIVGCLMLADNFGLLQIHWAGLWKLWPFVIIGAGLSILSSRDLFWRIISLVISMLMLGAVVWVMVADYPDINVSKTTNFSIQKTSNIIKQAEIVIKAGASSLNIKSEKQHAVVKSNLKSNFLSISKTSTVSGSIQRIDLAMDSNRSTNWWVGDMENIWDVEITRSLPLSLNIDAGASSVDVDMSDAMLRSATVKIGAGSLIMKVGDLEDVVNLNIESGVSSVTLRLPRASGVQLRLDSGLASNNLADLIKTGDKIYESSGYVQAKKKINIASKTGVSSFTIERY